MLVTINVIIIRVFIMIVSHKSEQAADPLSCCRCLNWNELYQADAYDEEGDDDDHDHDFDDDEQNDSWTQVENYKILDNYSQPLKQSTTGSPFLLFFRIMVLGKKKFLHILLLFRRNSWICGSPHKGESIVVVFVVIIFIIIIFCC